jgi:cysteine desulfurase/selenocysteine lyase
MFSLDQIKEIRKQFPILERKVNGAPLVYLDNASTTQKPLAVINGIRDYYQLNNSNVHRGVHTLSQEASALYEKSREKTASWFGVQVGEIAFTSGTTESINLIARGFLAPRLIPGDEILLTGMEHHSNIVPWQMIAEEKGAHISVIPVKKDGTLDMDEANKLMHEKTRMLAFTHVSNTMGTINDAATLCALARQKNIPVLVDGAQSAPHMQVNLRELNCDFFVCSVHKLYAGMGLGILYVHPSRIPQLHACKGGGGMIKEVSFEKTSYADFPLMMEAGTPNVEAVVSLSHAFGFLEQTGMENIRKHEDALCAKLIDGLQRIHGIRIIGQAKERASVVSFVAEGIHPFDIGTLLDQQGIAVRTGHHCTQPLMKQFGLPGTVRASMGMYNTEEEIEVLLRGLEKALKMLR